MENDDNLLIEEDPIIPIAKLIELLTATAERCLFIPGRINRVSVGRQLDLLGSGLPEAREAHRQTVDHLLTAALLHSTERSTDQLFQAAPAGSLTRPGRHVTWHRSFRFSFN